MCALIGRVRQGDVLRHRLVCEVANALGGHIEISGKFSFDLDLATIAAVRTAKRNPTTLPAPNPGRGGEQ